MKFFQQDAGQLKDIKAIKRANSEAQFPTSEEAPDRTATLKRSSLSQEHEALRSKQAQALQLEAVRKSIAFTQIVSLMMRSPAHQDCKLSDLHWLLLPALHHNQLKIVEARVNNVNAPAGFLLWASVSPAVDERLTQSLRKDAPVRLTLDEWKSGDILWLIETVGDPRAIKTLLRDFRETHPGGGEAKVRTRSRDGKAAIVKLGSVNLDADAPAMAP